MTTSTIEKLRRK